MSKLRWVGCWAGALITLSSAGCKRADTECLARIGRKLADGSQTALTNLQDQLQVDWERLPITPSLEQRIHLRLQTDRDLAAAGLSVKVQGNEVEVTGNLASDDLKNHALKLIETTQGVERVVDHITVRPLAA